MKKKVDTSTSDTESTPLDFSIRQFKGKGMGLGDVSIAKLEGAGITSVFDVCVRGSTEIAEVTGMAKSDVTDAMKSCYQVIQDSGYCRKKDMTVVELLMYRKSLPKISTKAKTIDALFQGGIEREALTEVYGEFGCGKTQFCNTIAVEAIHDYDIDVLWIDCEDTFDPERIIQIVIAKGYAETEQEAIDNYLSKFIYIHTPNTDLLLSEVDNMSTRLLDKNIKLVILDGSIGQFRQEYLGRGTLSIRQNALARFMGMLKNYSFFFSIAILFTNQVQTDPAMMFGDPIKPIGGNVVAHASTYRMYFKKAGSKRIAKMIDSPKSAQEEIRFSLTDKGIEDEKK